MKKILLFRADWCGSSISTAKTFVHVSKLLQIPRESFEIIDVETENGVKLSCLYNVKNVPTMILLDDFGEEIDRVKGKIKFNEMKNLLKVWVKKTLV